MRKFFFLVVYFFLSCTKPEVEKSSFQYPKHFPLPDFPATTNQHQVYLGKKLFYDPVLSGDSSISCASCHNQAFAFTDQGNAFSKGTKGIIGQRNAPPLFNLAWEKSFFWDGGVSDLETQALAPLTDEKEMHQSLQSLITKLQHSVEYRRLFKDAFGTDTIYSKLVLTALAQYERSIVSAHSKYDKYLLSENNLSETEMKGMLIVQEKCSSCHAGILFTDHLYHNNGLDSVFPDFSNSVNPQLGRARITHLTADVGKYKTPTLRNLSMSAPYMHDGRMASLVDVLNHYAHGTKSSYTLDTTLTKGILPGIPLDQNEIQLILEFLLTLNDYDMIYNKNYSASE